MGKVTAGTIVGGKYRLERPIGQGGMASVWRAIHTTLESPIAVKFLETYGSNREKMAKRFLREAKLAANLKHRNVVHILDYGMMDDGQPFMAMELLSGISLGDKMTGDEPPTPIQLLEIAAQILSGLAAVHDAGIVHRDVKPDNIFIVRDADGDYPKLLDFGISRGTETVPGETRMTNTGAVVGTPLYMSPEQARGLKNLDARTDLWSVGMILYEGLAGFCPFESENMGDVLIRVATEAVPPLTEARTDLPVEVGDAVMRALEKDPEKRFPDARTMREALLDAADRLVRFTVSPDRASRRLPSQRIDQIAWEEADTIAQPGLAPAADDGVAAALEADGAPAAASAHRGRRPWWPLAVFFGAIGVAAVAFIALGGEIRFGAAEAEGPTDDLGPTATPPVGSSAADETPADTVVAPADAAGEVERGRGVERDAEVETPAEVEPVIEAEVSDPRPVEEPEVRAEPVPRPAVPTGRRGRGRTTRPSPTVTARPPPANPPAGAAGGASQGTQQGRGGFLRDLDY
jgi:serine/threonine-protein kinase